MTDKQPEALRLADEADHRDFGLDPEPTWIKNAAAELRRLHGVNGVLLGIFKRIHLEKGFACECGIEDATWALIEAVLAKATGEQQ